MPTTTRAKKAASRPRRGKIPSGPNGDADGVSLKRDTDVTLGDDLPDPTGDDFVMLDDDDWDEGGSR